MPANDLQSTARELVANNKGILAADESIPTIGKRFGSIGIESTEENRRAYRDMLLTTPGLQEFISGVILFDETIRQSASDGTPFPALLEKEGIIPGIKVDTGAKDLAFFPGEKVTEGLDGLRERFAEYRELGARFAKWRAVITIAEATPSQFCIDANAHALARYAALAQEAGLVPIVEPEVLMDGDHSIARCYDETQRTLTSVFEQLHDHRVQLDGMLLKTNMVVSGTEDANQASVAEVASETLRCLEATVPPEVPGIVFLSGGQTDELATAHLNEMNARGKAPWVLSFSYGRALQAPALNAWKGDAGNVDAGQSALLHRAKLNAAANAGRYSVEMESAA
ncbi:MAG TPA: class I fructose-bisphosphate aldolase [Actinomycetota bacterium]|jgi:fructose-bisphosphate aldolase class I|nr:class I fructose-bisphosphate aldolase [Actinomycetota bacterium]